MSDLAGSLANVALALVMAYLAVAALAFFAADRIIFQPPAPTYDGDAPGVVRLTTSDDAELAALWLPNASAELTILYSHGNAEDLGTARPGLEALRELGFSVLAYDYRGYGRSDPRRPSERGAYRDIVAAYDHLLHERGVAPERIVLYGASVGSGPSIDLAARRPVGGLILEAPFTTAFRVVTRVPIFPFDRFRNIEKIDDISRPVLVMHGTSDGVVPFAHGRRIFEEANEPKRRLWVDNAGHNNLRWVAGPAYHEAVRALGERVLERANEP